MKDFLKKHKNFIFLGLFLVLWITLVVLVPPSEIVEIIGVETGYLLVFLIGLIGISSLSSGSFYVVLITLASTGEFNPFILALTSALAMTIGDVIFFIFSSKGREVIKEKNSKLAQTLTSWTENLSDNQISVLAYIYSGFTPFPQDILMIVLGVGGAPLWRVAVAALLGNFTLTLIISLILV